MATYSGIAKLKSLTKDDRGWLIVYEQAGREVTLPIDIQEDIGIERDEEGQIVVIELFGEIA